MSSNNWINHVKEFAKNNDLSYSCALSNPECKTTYKPITKKIKIIKKKEQVSEKPPAIKKIKIIKKEPVIENKPITKKIKIIKKTEPVIEIPKVIEKIPITEKKKIKIIKKKEPITQLDNKQILKIIRKLRRSVKDKEGEVDKSFFKNREFFYKSLKIYIRRYIDWIVPDIEKIEPAEKRKEYIEDKLKVSFKKLAKIQNNSIDIKIYTIIRDNPNNYEEKVAPYVKLYIKPNKFKMTFEGIEDDDEEDLSEEDEEK